MKTSTIEEIQTKEIWTISDIAVFLQVSYHTAQRRIKEMRCLGLAEPAQGRFFSAEVREKLVKVGPGGVRDMIWVYSTIYLAVALLTCGYIIGLNAIPKSKSKTDSWIDGFVVVALSLLWPPGFVFKLFTAIVSLQVYWINKL